MATFLNQEAPITREDLDTAIGSIGIRFPCAVTELYLSANGGTPEPYVFEDERIDTVGSELLPLVSERKSTVVAAYQNLVLAKKVVPLNLFPFAVDGGGDYFFVDCATENGSIYFLRSDSASGPQLLNLGVDFKRFWSALVA